MNTEPVQPVQLKKTNLIFNHRLLRREYWRGGAKRGSGDASMPSCPSPPRAGRWQPILHSCGELVPTMFFLSSVLGGEKRSEPRAAEE